MNFKEFAKLPSSEKYVLCRANANTQFKIFELTGNIYSRGVDHFVTSVMVNGKKLNKATSANLNQGEFWFEALKKKLHVRLLDDVNPKTTTLVATYTFFFSTSPIILPWDLQNGEEVEWDARISKDGIGALGQQLDDQNTGIVLESSSSISLINSDGYFDNIFDTLLWENRDIEFFSWSPMIKLSEHVSLFSGLIESKGYTTSNATFKVKDFVYRLKNAVSLGTFTETDGKIADSIIGKPKRRIYGKVKQARCIGLDNILDGFSVAGTISATEGLSEIIGTGTTFLKDLTPNDSFVVVLDDGEKIKLTIDSVESDTLVLLGSDSRYNFTDKPIFIKPDSPRRFKNRRWHLAGHKLRKPIAEITNVITSRRFYVNSVNDFFENDLVVINGQTMTIKRISGRSIVLKSSIFPVPQPGDKISKNPISNVFIGSSEVAHGRDWNLIESEETIIELSEEAEFNISNERRIATNLMFTNGSRVVSYSGQLDVGVTIMPNDWIRKDSLYDSTWYEVLDVSDSEIILRKPYAGTTQVSHIQHKSISTVSDDSLITANCLGLTTEENGREWIKTASDTVRHLLKNDAGFSDIDEEAFSQARSDCGYIVSMIIPENIGDPAPQVRDVITKINESVFGSLFKSNKGISYEILNSRKPTDMEIIKDDDIDSPWQIKTDQSIVNLVRVNYRPFTDIFKNDNAFEVVEFESSFVNNHIGIKNTEEKTVYLYDKHDAEIVAQRIGFFKSLSSCKLSIKGKLNLSHLTVNNKVFIELERLFTRYGGGGRKKIAIITGTKYNGFNTELELSDLGNIFNRVPSVSPMSIVDHASTSESDRVRYGFIVDNDTLTPDVLSEIDLGNNRIG